MLALKIGMFSLFVFTIAFPTVLTFISLRRQSRRPPAKPSNLKVMPSVTHRTLANRAVLTRVAQSRLH